MTLTPDVLPAALARARAIIEAGETALPTITAETKYGTFTMIIAAEGPLMERAFDVARKVMIYPHARTFIITGETLAPDTLYAGWIQARRCKGLFQTIQRSPTIGFSEPMPLPPESLAPMQRLAVRGHPGLSPEETKKIRSLPSLHSELEEGTPLVITPKSTEIV